MVDIVSGLILFDGEKVTPVSRRCEECWNMIRSAVGRRSDMVHSRRHFLKTGLAATSLAAAAGPLLAAPTKRSATDLVTLGNSGVKVSRLAFGTGTMSGRVQRELGQDQFNRLVRHAYDNGVRFFETAESYPGMPEMLGIALKGIPRDSYMLMMNAGDVVQLVIRGLGAIAGLAFDVEEQAPCGRELAVLLATGGEVDERRDRWLEPLTLRERGACFGGLAGCEQLATLAKHRLCLRAGGLRTGRPRPQQAQHEDPQTPCDHGPSSVARLLLEDQGASRHASGGASRAIGRLRRAAMNACANDSALVNRRRGSFAIATASTSSTAIDTRPS